MLSDYQIDKIFQYLEDIIEHLQIFDTNVNYEDRHYTFYKFRDELFTDFNKNRQELSRAKEEISILMQKIDKKLSIQNNLLAIQIAFLMNNSELNDTQINKEQIEESILNLAEKQRSILDLAE